jgi:diguanylate cyclase (GGDEF)-like protein/PAS domain S-box-containing protein
LIEGKGSFLQVAHQLKTERMMVSEGIQCLSNHFSFDIPMDTRHPFQKLRHLKQSFAFLFSHYRFSRHGGYMMKDQSKTKQALIQELVSLRQRIVELDQSEAERKKAEEALRKSEAQLRAILDATPFPIALVDVQDNKIDFWSRSALSLFGHIAPTTPEWYQIAYPDPDYQREVIDRWKPFLEIARESCQTVNTGEYRVTCSDGSVRICELYTTFLADRLIVTFNDITERKRAEEELRRNQDVDERLAQEMAIIAEIGKVISSTLDPEEVYERFAAESKKLIPFDRLVVNLNNPQENERRCTYVSGVDIPGRRPGDSKSLSGSTDGILLRIRSGIIMQADSVEKMATRFPGVGTVLHAEAGLCSLLSVPLIYRDDVIGTLHFWSKKSETYTEKDLRLAEKVGSQIAGAIANAQLYASLKKAEKELKESEKRYRELSIIDGLTQLNNSRHFYFQLKIELDRSNRYGQPLTLLLLDLDDFKRFNDTYGHVEGDQVLFRLGQVVKRCLRETDFAYRYGGEEFTVILPMTTSADGANTAERIRTEFKKETFSPVPGQDVHVTVSIGLAQYKLQEEMKAFVHRVDQFMYQGKRNGKDRVCCES